MGCFPTDHEITISHYDPAEAFAGNTYFQAHAFYPGYYKVNMLGDVLWHRTQGMVIVGNGVGLDVMENENVLTMFNSSHPTMIDTRTDQTLWAAEDPNKATRAPGEPDRDHQGHHSVVETPWGTVMTLELDDKGPDILVQDPVLGRVKVVSDSIIEIDPDSNLVVWKWRLRDYLEPTEHFDDFQFSLGNGVADWSHCNSVKILENYRYEGRTYPAVILILARNLDTFWMIDYPSGNILWSCGQHGNFGRREPPLEPLFVSAHGIDMLENGNFILYDNGDRREPIVSRALEISVDPVAETAHEVWSWTDPDMHMFSPWGGDADRLPNGNTLVSYGQTGRIAEVSPSGEKVWQLDIKHPVTGPGAFSVFMAMRVAD